MNLTPAQCEKSLETLRRHRHELVMTLPKPQEASENLVLFLRASLTVTAIDNAIKLLERELAEVAS